MDLKFSQAFDRHVQDGIYNRSYTTILWVAKDSHTLIAHIRILSLFILLFSSLVFFCLLKYRTAICEVPCRQMVELFAFVLEAGEVFICRTFHTYKQKKAVQLALRHRRRRRLLLLHVSRCITLAFGTGQDFSPFAVFSFVACVFFLLLLLLRLLCSLRAEHTLSATQKSKWAHNAFDQRSAAARHTTPTLRERESEEQAVQKRKGHCTSSTVTRRKRERAKEKEFFHLVSFSLSLPVRDDARQSYMHPTAHTIHRQLR